MKKIVNDLLYIGYQISEESIFRLLVQQRIIYNYD
jgi:hypothetical protein